VLGGCAGDRRSGGLGGPLRCASSPRRWGVKADVGSTTHVANRERDHRRPPLRSWSAEIALTEIGGRLKARDAGNGGAIGPSGPAYATPGPPWAISRGLNTGRPMASASSMPNPRMPGGGGCFLLEQAPITAGNAVEATLLASPCRKIQISDRGLKELPPRWPPLFPAPAFPSIVFPPLGTRLSAPGDRVGRLRTGFHAFSFGLEVHP